MGRLVSIPGELPAVGLCYVRKSRAPHCSGEPSKLQPGKLQPGDGLMPARRSSLGSFAPASAQNAEWKHSESVKAPLVPARTLNSQNPRALANERDPATAIAQQF